MAIVYPTTLDNFTPVVDGTDYPQAFMVNDLYSAVQQLETKVGVNSSSITTSLDYKVNNFFATGRKLWLYENTAPTGWTIASVTDKVLAVKGGTGEFNANGGTNSAGTAWTMPHVHQWYHHVNSSVDNSFATDGSSFDIYEDNNRNYNGIAVNTHDGNDIGSDYYTTNPLHIDETDRPPAALGIIVTKS